MELESIIDNLEKEIKDLFCLDTSGHDIYHLKRTLNTALHIHEKEGGDRLVIAISAFLHDIHRIIQNETKEYCHPRNSLAKVEEIIHKAGIDLSEKQLKMILHCIEYHEEYSFNQAGKTVNDIETLILQDADNLDAIGAIGIARTFAYGGANNMPIWNNELLNEDEKYEEKISDDSTIHHFCGKLLKLKDDMNTETAQKLALHRHKFMEAFLGEFFEEWNGRT
ncbi:MAG: HD domain-containing protein [Ignavibacteriales bacterium]